MNEQPRILLVDDSDLMRQLLRVSLGRLRHAVIDEADDGITALQQLAANQYQLVIVDINMPVMDGLKLIGHIRKDQRHKDTNVVVVSTERTEEQKKMPKNIQGWLQKPISGTELLAVIEKLI